jgi:hypothetical protein
MKLVPTSTLTKLHEDVAGFSYFTFLQKQGMMIMASVEKKINKSEFVRNILKDIGALSQNPPEGWRNKVQEALLKNNLKMNPVTIYGLRTKAMRSNGSEDKSLRSISKEKYSVVRKTTNNKAHNNFNDITLKQLRSVQEFADNFGGIDNLSRIIDALKAFKNN